jgi:hypothetical protein
MAAARASRIGPTLCVIFTLLIALALPNRYVLGPRWIARALEIALLALLGVSIFSGTRFLATDLSRRINDLATIAVVSVMTAFNISSLSALIKGLIFESRRVDAHRLLSSSVFIWIANILVFAMLYWLIDGGGPDTRIASDAWHADFAFPQSGRVADAALVRKPNFVDYLFVAFTTATAFSPTDTAPLTTRARVLMMIEGGASLLTISIAAARAISILQ